MPEFDGGVRGARASPDVRGIADALGAARWEMHADAAGVAGRRHLPDTAGAARELVDGLALAAAETAAMADLLVAHRYELVDVAALRTAGETLRQAVSELRGTTAP